MSRVSLKRGFLALVTMVTAVAFVSTTWAEEQIEEVVVTGSYIKGTPEDAALPVDVLSRADMEDVGDPSILSLIHI